MSKPALTPGVYAIINARGNHALDINGDQVVADLYIGSTSQQWSLSTHDGVSWYIQNVSSGKYLGLPANLQARNSLQLQEVAHMFAWHLNRKESEFLCVSTISVPYSNFVLDLDPAQATSAGSHILSPYIFEDNQKSETHQGWVIRQNLHLETPLALENGCIYKIANALKTNFVTTFADDGFVGASRPGPPNFKFYPPSDSDMFQAIGKGQTWAFKNISSGRYLGIPLALHPPKDAQVTRVDTQFTWMVIPYYEPYRPSFKIWAPFVKKVMGVASFNTITSIILTDDDVHNEFDMYRFLWTFHKVSGLAAERSDKPGTVPGVRDRE